MLLSLLDHGKIAFWNWWCETMVNVSTNVSLTARLEVLTFPHGFNVSLKYPELGHMQGSGLKIYEQKVKELNSVPNCFFTTQSE